MNKFNKSTYNKIYGRKWRLSLKIECFGHYGNKCACCLENNIRFLTLDHKNGGGNKHRKTLFGSNVGGCSIYQWLKDNNYPQEEYQLLCMNCNFATRYGEICPHKLERSGVVIPDGLLNH